MSEAPEPAEPAVPPPGTPEVSAAAQLARERLHEEIERVRNGVEEMLDEQEGNGNGHAQAQVPDQAPAPVSVPVPAPIPVVDPNFGASSEELRRELNDLRLETRTYVKRKVRKSEKKLERSVRELEARSDELERRIDQVEADREEAEWRIHTNTEDILDGLLDDVRSIADRLAKPPAPTLPKLAPRPAPRVAQPQPRTQPVGRIGRPAPKR